MECSAGKNSRVIKVGTRKSQLAIIQTETVINKLKRFYINNGNVDQQVEFDIVPMSTAGDKILDKPLPDIGTKSLFTKELETALLDGRVDMIVHSLKDLPTTLPEGCVIGAVLKRDDPNDVVVLKKKLSAEMNPVDLLLGKYGRDQEGKKYIIGTSSQRRIAMIRQCNESLDCINIRGNLNTRLALLDRDDSEYTAIVLAKAGLDRMGWSDRASSILTPEEEPKLNGWFYAVGQGAIAVECRSNDDSILKILEPIVDLKTTYEVVAERSFMRKLEGGCSVPLGVRSRWKGDDLTLQCGLLSMDGKQLIKADGTATLPELSGEKADLESSKPASHLVFTGITSPGCTAMDAQVTRCMNICSDLGVEVANKVINLGGLEIIKRLR